MNGNLPQAVVGQQSFIISIMKCLFIKKKTFGTLLAVVVSLSHDFYILHQRGARLARTIIVRPNALNKIRVRLYILMNIFSCEYSIVLCLYLMKIIYTCCSMAAMACSTAT